MHGCFFTFLTRGHCCFMELYWAGALAGNSRGVCETTLSPLLKAPGVLNPRLGPRGTAGVDGPEKVARTAVSVRPASGEPSAAAFGFSCFCCTASSWRRSRRAKWLNGETALPELQAQSG